MTSNVKQRNLQARSFTDPALFFSFVMKGPRTTALRLFVQPCDEDEKFFLPIFTINETPVE
jgi:hypothetical protein